MAFFNIVDNTLSTTCLTQGHKNFTLDFTGKLWCAYSKAISGLRQVFVAYSKDRGHTWFEEQVTNIPDNIGAGYGQCYPSMVVDKQGDVHLAYSGAVASLGRLQVFYQKRESGVWLAREQLTALSSYDQGAGTNILIDHLGEIYVFWCAKGYGSYPSVFSAAYRKKNTSEVWEDVELIASISGYNQSAAKTFLDTNNNIHVGLSGTGWGTYPTKWQPIYIVKTSAGWQAPELLRDENYDGAGAISITTDMDHNVYIIVIGKGYGANPTVNNVKVLRQVAGIWQSVESITDTTNTPQVVPSIISDLAGRLYVAWAGKGWGANPTKYSIQYRIYQNDIWEDQGEIINTTYDCVTPVLLYNDLYRRGRFERGAMFVFNSNYGTGLANDIKGFYFDNIKWVKRHYKKRVYPHLED